MKLPSALAALLLTTTTLSAAPPPPPPLPAEAHEPRLVASPEFSPEPRFRSGLTGDAQATHKTIRGGTGPVVHRVTVPAGAKNAYAIEISWHTVERIAKGEPLLARFLARTLDAKQETGEATFGFYFQQAASPWDKSVSTEVSVGSDWKWFEIPFAAHTNFAPGDATANLSFAFYPQVLEFTAPEIFAFAPGTRLENLPRTRFTYEGREADAPWRAAALARIEALRVAPIRIHVSDAQGAPVAGARVEAHLVEPEFLFGSEIDSRLVAEDSPKAGKYRSIFLENFDAAVIGNGLKWQRWINPNEGKGVLWPRAQTLAALDWLSAQPHLRLKGHVLVWGGWNFTPEAVRALPDSEQRLPSLINAHIRDIIAATRGRLAIWDVLNEPLNEPDYLDLLGLEAAADWFKLARELDPKAKLYLNEYRILSGPESRVFVEKYLTLVARLRAAGAPIDGLGIQGHLGQQVLPPERVIEDLDLLATAGLPIQITEFDINTADEQLQADYTRDFLIACYSHPAVNGFFNWGFWEGQHWIPQAAMFRRDWSPKPNATVWREWVLSKWRTRIDSTTTTEGVVTARGHRGTYLVTVRHADIVREATLTLGATGAELSVRLP